MDDLDLRLVHCRRVAILEARRRGLTSDEAEDIAQEVTLQLWTALTKGKEVRNIGGWSRVASARLVMKNRRDANTQKRGGGALESLTGLSESQFATS
jgi:DNA-directed RNA polymerase specialized sigma24 family protein